MDLPFFTQKQGAVFNYASDRPLEDDEAEELKRNANSQMCAIKITHAL